MKSRLWVLVILVLLLLGIGGYVTSFRLLDINERVEMYITEIISDKIGVDFTTESLSILPWSIRLNSVLIQPRSLPLTVSIKRIRVQFNLFTLLFHNFQPLYSLEQIFLDDPLLEWNLAETDSMPERLSFQRPTTFTFESLPSTRINIVDGAAVVTRGDSTLVFAEQISGWIDGYKTSSVEINVEGNVLSDELNTTCKGTIIKQNHTVNIDLISDGCNLAADNIEVVSGDIDPASGMLDYSLHAELVDGIFSLDGEYTIESGSFLLKTLDIGASDISVAGTLSEKEIRFDSITGSILGVKPEIAGRIMISTSPILELFVQADSVALTEPLETLFPDMIQIPSGTLSFSSVVAGPLTNVTANTDITITDLAYHGRQIDTLSFHSTIAGDVLKMDGFSMQYDGWSVSADGRLNDLYHAGNRSFGLAIYMNRENETESALIVTTSGTADIDSHIYDSHIELVGTSVPSPISGQISYHDDMLVYSLDDSLAAIEGTIVRPFGEGIIDGVITLQDTPVMQYSGHGGGPVFTGSSRIAGSYENLTIENAIRIVWSDQFSSLYSGTILMNEIMTSNRHISIDGRLLDLHLRYSPVMSWDVNAEITTQRIQMSISDPAGAILNVGADLSDNSLTGRLDLDEFPLEWIIELFVREEFSHRGKISGYARIDGTISEPVFETPEPLSVADMTLAGLHRLEGRTNVSGSMDHLAFNNVEVYREGLPIIYADGIWIKGNPFYLTAEGESFNLSAIEDVISDTRRTEGVVNYHLDMSFTRENGRVHGTFSASDGYFYDIPFDSLSGDMSGGSDGFSVDNFTIERQNVYSGIGNATSGYFWRDHTENPGLRLHLVVNGDVISVLPHLTGAISDAHGECQADLIIGGTWQEPIALDGGLTVNNGTVKPAFLIEQISDIDAELRIESETQTATGLQAVRVIDGTGVVGDRRLTVSTVHVSDENWEHIERPGLLSVPNESINLDFGVLGVSVRAIRGRDDALKLHVPGFMETGETGMFDLVGYEDDTFYVGASDNGNELTPYLSGKITVLSGDIYYPFLDAGDESGDVDTSFLSDIFWDLEINGGPNVNYVKEYNFEIGRFGGTTLWQNEIRIDENSTFFVNGRIDDDSFRVTGEARSNNGFIVYYGYRFDIDYAELFLDTDNELSPAILTGRARTIVYDDTLGTENEIFLHVDFINRETGRVTGARGDLTIRDGDYYDQNRLQTRFDAGALGIIEIRFSSSNPADDTQEKILAKLGISPDNIGAAATRALTAGIDNFYFNPLLRPFEEKLKQILQLDMVKISPSIIGTFAQESLYGDNDVYLGAETYFAERSKVTLGEYFMKDWFISYTAQYGIGRDFLYRKERGFYHDIGLQYSVERNLRFQGRYIYDEIIDQNDARLEFRYDFTFD